MMPSTPLLSPGAAAWSVAGRVCIVTGANSGIGKEVAAELAAQGADVVMACRSQERCMVAKDEIVARGQVLEGRLTCIPLDISCAKSVQQFASTIRKRHSGKVAVLVHNAGVMGVSSSGPTIHHDPHFLTNHVGTFAVTQRLLARPSVLAPHSRVVVVGSQAHRRGTLSISSDLRVQGTPSNWYTSYARSKLANSLFSLELQRRLREDGAATDVFTVSPGRVQTNIFESIQPAPLRWVIKAVSALMHQTPAQGARTVLMATSDPKLTGKGGLYLHDCAAVPPSPLAQDGLLAKQLWAASELLVASSDDTVTITSSP